ncbi:MAG TPA: hypothetical protein PLM29_03075 [Deltaproteobacteria bacterium]|nr:hypothetical protein [Deltaproteobacteria bacterium]
MKYEYDMMVPVMGPAGMAVSAMASRIVLRQVMLPEKKSDKGLMNLPARS